MATAARQPKPTRKGPPQPAQRTPAWSGARASPTFSPPPNPTRPQPVTSPTAATFPPLAQANGGQPNAAQDRVLQSLSGLTGTTVTLITKTAQRYEGVVGSTSSEGDTTGVTLKDVKEISNPGAPLKDSFFIASTNIDSWSSGPADAKPSNGDTFRTDTDISQKKGTGRERELQQWSSDEPPALGLGQGDDDTFGLGSNNTSWDQFAANEKLFGVKTQFDENVYTTKLDRSAADFKERERNAQRIANEIIGSATSNPHIAEERNLNVDDSGINEEDKYGAVVRGTNAYVPPGARRPDAVSPPVSNVVKAEIPKVSVNGPDGAALPSQTQSPASSKAPSPAPPNKPPADPLPAFRDFVTNEKQRLTQKRQALVKSEMDKRMAELVKFSKSFKLNKPMPDDLVPILAKDEEKQRAIREKANKDAASTQARAIGATTPANASRGTQIATAKIAVDANRTRALAPTVKTATPNAPPPQSAALAPKSIATAKPATIATPAKNPSGKPAISMVIQAIPPYKGHTTKPRQSSGPASTTSPQPPANGKVTVNTTGTSVSSSNNTANAAPMSPATAANRLNVNASSFRPNPKANAFNPGAPSPNQSTANQNGASASVSPKAKPDASPSTPNPFFGTRPIKKSTPVNIKDDFNPFKHHKVVDASQVSAMWPYNGKRYMQMFPQPQHQPQPQHPAHMPPPGPPPMPPPSYEEDSAAQAAARGYVYAYPPYGYPGQPMMPGMAPPGPPGTYMPGPYMQHMPYPPGMPPPNAMYSPAMGQMPPPQTYMPPPPPGPYPPPNGAGPRPSMPPTPIPAHAHPYYHQSPQLQHAVPYHMMMPPPNVPQHPYDGGPAPPVQMGGHA
ncbi:hypothetical protein BDZ94DRAFT_1318189 [Collybia nuda]|uniref:LsmAD domain-containing protein n=1 Tax=Collybia nuda TaxID=64659 RepID=A0A9P6CNA8_9AGAR|nr:hypothetical protein BDZ94DRAFT_1318189 [Collybia nuda]